MNRFGLPALLALACSALFGCAAASGGAGGSAGGGASSGSGSATGTAATKAGPRTTQEIIDSAPASDWRALAPEHTLYLDVPSGRVIIELEPALAPRMVERIEALAHRKFYDGLPVERVQDNYVVQWGNADGAHPMPEGMKGLTPEFSVPLPAARFTRTKILDGFAPQVGFVDSFPAARDPATGEGWLTHCYGAVGVGRDMDPASGDGSELYVVIGHAPRHLDRNVIVVGRVRQGIEHLSSLPRGTGEMGFYKTPGERTDLVGLHLASDLSPLERTPLEVLRSDSASFGELIDARRNRSESFFIRKTNYVDLCNVPLPVRVAKP